MTSVKGFPAEELHVPLLMGLLFREVRDVYAAEDWGGLRQSHFRVVSRVPHDSTDRCVRLVRRTPKGRRTRRSVESWCTLRCPLSTRLATNCPHPCLVMPTRSPRSVTLIPSGGTLETTRKCDCRRPPQSSAA